MLELFAIRFCPHTSKIEQWAIQSGWRMKDADGGWRVRTHLNTYIKSNECVYFNFCTRKMCADDGWRVRTHVNTALICLRWETYTLKVVFVEHHTRICVYVSLRSQIQFEDENHAIYMSFCWVTTTCLRWEPKSVTLWLYPVDHRNQYFHKWRSHEWKYDFLLSQVK